MLRNHIIKLQKYLFVLHKFIYKWFKNIYYKWFNDDRSTHLGYLIVVPNMCLKFATDWGTYCQLGFSSKIEMPQLGLTRLGTFSDRFGSAREISARTHHYLGLVCGGCCIKLFLKRLKIRLHTLIRLIKRDY